MLPSLRMVRGWCLPALALLVAGPVASEPNELAESLVATRSLQVRTAAQSAASVTGCPAVSEIFNLCTAVDEKGRVPIPGTSRSQFEFVAMVHAAACVRATDSEADRRSRIQSLWRDHQAAFGCTVPGFDLDSGNVLKMAVRRRSFELLNLVLEEWHLDVNIVDPVDGRTFLDYLEAEIGLNTGQEIEPTLREYYELFREAGARHCRELPVTTACRTPSV